MGMKKGYFGVGFWFGDGAAALHDASDQFVFNKLQEINKLISTDALHSASDHHLQQTPRFFFFLEVKMDPYVIIICQTQEQKSNVASGQGSSPERNETFEFSVTSDEEPELVIKIQDNDVGSEDDIVGEAKYLIFFR
ncbi:hypothetical protein L1987_05978 [Smallanthus sonchifolius]|uniref:Uncharacterized protein n=1 Tax=Smallanthus sonchifolius TaxID=185202 RepID=A0ACB9JWW5_9ASTR|nr:hypothetical protein L1987_05978 [Smallanthus sonchifolius]